MEFESFELRRLPKIDLHRHLDCSLRWSTFVELLQAHHIKLNPDHETQLKNLLVIEPMHDLEAVLKKFLSLQQVFSTEEILTRIAFEVVEDAYNDGVVKLELRYAPTFINEKFPDLSFDKIHAALYQGISDAKEKFPVQVGLIVIMQRIKDIPTNEKVADFIISHQKTLVGIDLADNEASALPSQFKNIFQRIHSRANLPVTVHAGESVFDHSEKSLHEAIEELGAARIGHGVQVYRYPQLVQRIKDKNIHLEICPISNHLTRAFPDWQSHSLPYLYSEGISLSINSDDPGMFGTTLTDEYLICQKYYNFTGPDFRKIFAMADKASFIKGKPVQ